MGRVASQIDQAALGMSYACIDIRLVADQLKQAHMDLEAMTFDGVIDRSEFNRLVRWVGILSAQLRSLVQAANAAADAADKAEDACETTLLIEQAINLGWQNVPDSNLRRKLKARKAENCRSLEAYRRRQERWGRQLVMFEAAKSGTPLEPEAA